MDLFQEPRVQDLLAADDGGSHAADPGRPGRGGCDPPLLIRRGIRGSHSETLSRQLNRWVEGALLVASGFPWPRSWRLQVFFRYALNHSLFWSEELARYLLVWLSLPRRHRGYCRGAHPGIDVLVARFPPPARRAALLAVHLAATGPLRRDDRRRVPVRAVRAPLQISPALHLPKWVPHAAFPSAALLFAVHGVALLLRDVRQGGRT